MTSAPSATRRLRRTVTLLLPAGVLASGLATTPAQAASAPPLPVPGTARLAVAPLLTAPVAGTSAVPNPKWTFPREAFLILLLSYVGLGAVAAVGIWSYLRRRW